METGNDGIEVFMRWVLRNGIANERTRSLVTLAMFLSDDERLTRLQGELSAAWLDERFVEELFLLAKPEEVVTLLTFRIGPHLSPHMFKAVFDRTLTATSDLRVMSGLMFVAGLFLDRYPGAFQLPRTLTDQLLASQDLDHRLAGLKALRHCMASPAEIVAQITVALRQNDWHERWAGLSQLGHLLKEKGPELAKATEQKGLDELRHVLTQMAAAAPDHDTRQASEHYIALLAPAGQEPDSRSQT